MAAPFSLSQVSAYASGAALGAVLLAIALGPHLRAEDFTPAHSAVACAARVSSDQAEALRQAVTGAQSWRDRALGGGSAYAAAKLGPTGASTADIAAAGAALADARARFYSTCG